MTIDINEKSKTKEGRQAILKMFYSITAGMDRSVDRICWDMYNNKFAESDYDYLRKYGEYVLPANVRHIPKQRPYIDYLTSRHIDRPYVFSVSAVDKESLKTKHANRTKIIVQAYIDTYKKRHFEIAAKIQQLDAQYQQVVGQMQQQGQPQNEQEAAQQQQMQQQAQMMLPQIQAAIENAKSSLMEMEVMNSKTLEQLKRRQKYNDREMIEQWAQSACRSLRQTLNIKSKSTMNFINNRVTGKQYYYVDYRIGDKTITYRTITPHNVFYQSTEDVMWVQDCDWAGFDEYMTPVDVSREFGDRLSDDERKTIFSGSQDFTTNGQGPFVAAEGNKVIDLGRSHDSRNVSSGSIDRSQNVNVRRVWWQAERQARAVQKPNPYRKGKWFTNIIADGEKVIDENDHHYVKTDRRWVSNKDETVFHGSDKVKTYNSKKGDRVIRRYAYDRYKGVIIDGRIFLAEKDPVQPRGVDELSKTWLPIVGPTFNNISQQPYSQIWATKDLQKLYNIVSYHRELMLAVSGTKTVLMDKTQKPTGMDDVEWRRNMKEGILEIETRKKGVGMLQPTFNQFQVLDMSLSASIQYIDAVLESIDTQMGLIMGVTRQAMGQVTNTDQVGTFQLSQRSTLLITQVLYEKHDEVEKEALNMMLRLAKEYLMDDDVVIQNIDTDGGENITRIPAGVLKKADFDIIVMNNSKEESSLIELKQIALQNYKAGLLPFHNFMQMYNIESLKELEKMSEYFAEKAQEIAQQQQQAQGDQAMAVEDKKGQLAMQMADFSAKQQQGIEQMKLQWEQAKKQSDDAFKSQELEQKAEELALKNKGLDQERYLTLFGLANTKSSEDNVVLENQRATNIDAQIRMFELQLQQMQAHMSKDTDEKKIKVEHEKARKMVKEHASNL